MGILFAIAQYNRKLNSKAAADRPTDWGGIFVSGFRLCDNVPNGDVAWSSNQTTVTTTDLVRAGHSNFQTVYSYKPISIPLPLDVVSGFATQVPFEYTPSYSDSSGSLLRRQLNPPPIWLGRSALLCGGCCCSNWGIFSVFSK